MPDDESDRAFSLPDRPPRAQPVALPEPLASYVDAVNRAQIDALMATFVDDGLVNDQLTEYRGRGAIREWALRDIIEEGITIEPVELIRRHGNIVVNAHVDGSFDKRGIPDPLVLTFYFSLCDGKIAQLIILPKQSCL